MKLLKWLSPGMFVKRWMLVAIIGLVLFSFVVILSLPLNEYLYALIGVNFQTYIGDEVGRRGIGGIGLMQIFFYPLIIFIKGQYFGANNKKT